MRLSDIIPTGYEEQLDTWCKGSKATGFANQITIQVLDDGGNVAKDAATGKSRAFLFTRAGKNGAWTEDGYWYRDGDKKDVISKDNEEFFDVGEGLWIQVAGSAYTKSGCGPDQYKLMHSGEALMDAKTINLRPNFIMMIPPLSADVKLSQIIPTGYEEQLDTWCKGSKATGFANQITIQVLDDGGNVAKDAATGKSRAFLFTRAGKNGAWTEDGYWYRDGDKKDVISKDNEEIFKMGEALWIQTAGAAYTKSGCGPDQYKLKFPGIDDGAASAE